LTAVLEYNHYEREVEYVDDDAPLAVARREPRLLARDGRMSAA
jgi:hypothetical protein